MLTACLATTFRGPHDFAMAVTLGLGVGMLSGRSWRRLRASGAVVALGGEPTRVPLYWQQWNLRSSLLDAVAAEVLQTRPHACWDPANRALVARSGAIQSASARARKASRSRSASRRLAAATGTALGGVCPVVR